VLGINKTAMIESLKIGILERKTELATVTAQLAVIQENQKQFTLVINSPSSTNYTILKEIMAP
jgi:hypothetical protein